MDDKRFDVVVAGELLVDFTSTETGDFRFNAGGGTANFAAAVSMAGMKAAFLGQVGEDLFGHMLEESLASYGVYTGALCYSENCRTSLAFVSTAPDGERDFVFYHSPGADAEFAPEQLNKEVLLSSSLVHISTVCATAPNGAAAVLAAARMAKENGILVSFDPNVRPALWKSAEACAAYARQVLPLCDIVKLSQEELELLFGAGTEQENVEKLIAMGPRLAVITAGAEGAAWYRRGECGFVPARKVKAVDTTGAGDCFFGSFIAKLLECHKEIEAISGEELANCMHYAAAAAALCVQRKGGMPALPKREAVEAYMACV